jgi:hypothetical protein
MTEEISIGTQVKVYFGEKFGEKEGWYQGVVVKIDPYSEHRSFYWVELNTEAQAQLGIKQISVFNIKNIQKI